MNNYLFCLSISALLCACQPADPPQAVTDIESHQATGQKPETIRMISALAETQPSISDGANDPAIILDHENPENSLILGATSEGGIEIYSLDGQRLHINDQRPITLVDVIYNFPLSGENITLILGFDPETSGIVPFTLNENDRNLKKISEDAFLIHTEAEGLCSYFSPLSGKFYVFAAGGGFIQQWELRENNGSVSGRRIRTLPVGFGAAHCVVDDRTSTLFYSQETVGVWSISAEPETDAEPVAVDLAAPIGRFEGDVKGLGLVQIDGDDGYLLASDADVNLIQVYELGEFQHVATFEVGSGILDGVDESEGIAASSFGFSNTFSNGIVVFTDDDNDGEHTNFKLVSWKDIADTYALKSAPASDPTFVAPSTDITVSASVETEPVSSHGDAADDPAIWVHPDQPEMSLIIGSQKKRGINVYGLDGTLLQTLSDGRINNIDVRYGFPLGDKTVDLVTGSNRTTDSISIYAVDTKSRTLVNVADGILPTGMADPYGLCMYHSAATGNYYVIVNDTDGVVKQWRLMAMDNDRIGTELVREFSVGSQTEGCVADDQAGMLYVGEEDVGIWKYSAEPDAGTERTQVDSTTSGNITDDVEGLTIYYGPGGSGYLLASNQGANSYAVYERSGDNEFLGIFHVVADEPTGVDGVSETDGLDATSANLGPDFPNGLFVVQDGRNITPAERQNFKLVPWERIAEAMNLEVHNGYDPRSQ